MRDMYKILDRVDYSADVFMQVIEAPAVAAACHAAVWRQDLRLNSIRVDGTGMCGGRRVSVGGGTKFVCVDGPEFDGHRVDFDLLMSRQRQYVSQEKESLDSYLSHSTVSDATACKRVETANV
jgi:hypothetical protein